MTSFWPSNATPSPQCEKPCGDSFAIPYTLEFVQHSVCLVIFSSFFVRVQNWDGKHEVTTQTRIFFLQKNKAHQHKTYSTWGLKQWSLAGSCPKFRCILSCRWMVKNKTQCWNLTETALFQLLSAQLLSNKSLRAERNGSSDQQKTSNTRGTIVQPSQLHKFPPFEGPNWEGTTRKIQGVPEIALWRYTDSTIGVFIPERPYFSGFLEPHTLAQLWICSQKNHHSVLSILTNQKTNSSPLKYTNGNPQKTRLPSSPPRWRALECGSHLEIHWSGHSPGNRDPDQGSWLQEISNSTHWTGP